MIGEEICTTTALEIQKSLLNTIPPFSPVGRARVREGEGSAASPAASCPNSGNCSRENLKSETFRLWAPLPAGAQINGFQRLQRCINQPRFARPHDEKPETSNEAPFSKVNPPWIFNTIIVTFSAYTVLSACKELSVHYLWGINLAVRWDGSSLSLCRVTEQRKPGRAKAQELL